MARKNNSHRPGAGSTGPKTPAGKDRSSRNAAVHGGRAETHFFLPGESPQDFAKLRQSWLDEYKPATELESRMVEHLAEREWAFRRLDRLVLEAEHKLLLNNPDLLSWTEQEHRSLQLLLRYRTACRRAFDAARNDVECTRANRVKEAIANEKLKSLVHHNWKNGMHDPEPVSKPDPENPECPTNPSTPHSAEPSNLAETPAKLLPL